MENETVVCIVNPQRGCHEGQAQDIAVGSEQETNGRHIGKKEIHLSSFSNSMITYLENYT